MNLDFPQAFNIVFCMFKEVVQKETIKYEKNYCFYVLGITNLNLEWIEILQRRIECFLRSLVEKRVAR